MSGVHGKNSISIRKKNVEENSLAATGFQALFFAHQASACDTSITFDSLVIPPEMQSRGFVNPTGSKILSSNIRTFKNNIEVVSSVNGTLIQDVTYSVGGASLNFICYTALACEIFTVRVTPIVQTGQPIVQARNLIATGTLCACCSDFNVGEAFEVNVNPNDQIGAVEVYLDGILQMRNEGNAVAAACADGNYEEVANLGNESNLIRFNVTNPCSQAIIVKSTNLIAERPCSSQLQTIESIGGQVDKIIPTLACLAGVCQSCFQNAPNSVDLKAFGDEVCLLKDTVGSFTTNQCVDTADKIYLISASGGARTVALRPAACETRVITIKKTDCSANTVTVTTNACETIDGVSTFILGGQFHSLDVVSDGSNYSITHSPYPVTAYVKEVQDNNVNGGTATSGGFCANISFGG